MVIVKKLNLFRLSFFALIYRVIPNITLFFCFVVTIVILTAAFIVIIT